MRKILLVEPNYKNKYPPMGLMKIATYYRRLGDDVTFFKGDLKELVLNNTYEALLKQLYANDDTIFGKNINLRYVNILHEEPRKH